MDKDKLKRFVSPPIDGASLRSIAADLLLSHPSETSHMRGPVINTSVAVMAPYSSANHSTISSSINPHNNRSWRPQVYGDINTTLWTSGVSPQHTHASTIHLPHAVDGCLLSTTILATLQESLSQQSGAIRALALVGIRGAGKSELAAVFVRQSMKEGKPSSYATSSSPSSSDTSATLNPVLAYVIGARTSYYFASLEHLAVTLQIKVDNLQTPCKPDKILKIKHSYYGETQMFLFSL